jgi:hypothetical protein
VTKTLVKFVVIFGLLLAGANDTGETQLTCFIDTGKECFVGVVPLTSARHAPLLLSRNSSSGVIDASGQRLSPARHQMAQILEGPNNQGQKGN